jgi:hypothetical protein
MSLSTPAKVGIVLLLVCLLLRLKPRDSIIILAAHYISHQVL